MAKILSAIITGADAGRKIKYFVRGALGVSYGQFTALKWTGGLRVNGEAVHADYVLRAGDRVEVVLSEHEHFAVEPDNFPVNIVYEDEDMLVIDKPAPLPCQRSEKQEGPTLENRLAARFGPGFLFRPVNRLDKGTSGLLCAAMHAHSAQLLQKQLHSGSFLREYRAVVCGVLSGEGAIDLPIAKADEASVRRVIDFERGKPSVTHWKSLGIFGEYSLIRLVLDTGRTHQIRVHMASIGHPVAGDFLYGTELDQLPGRFALHSARVRLRQPISGEWIDAESPLPAELRALIDPCGGGQDEPD